MTVRDSLIGLLAPQIGEARAIHLLNDFVVSATVGSRTSREEHRAQVLAEEAATPLIVRRFDTSIEPALEDENPELLVCAMAEGGRPVALLLDDEARNKLAGLLGLGKGKGTGTTGGEPTPTPFFEPDRTYRSGPMTFQCHVVSGHPQTGEQRALGWWFYEGDGLHQWVPAQLDPDDYAAGIWAETGGDR